MATVAPAELSFIASTADDSNSTTYTFTSQSLGAVDGTRRIVVVCHWNGATLTLSSATIAGISATVHAQTNGTNNGIAIISALVPTGTSGTIAFTLSGAGSLRAYIGVYRAIGGVLLSPNDTLTDNTIASAAFSGTINIPSVGWVVAGSSWGTLAGTSHTWAGVTEQYDVKSPEAAGINWTGGFDTGLALQTGRTVSDTVTDASGATGCMAAISWG